MAGATCGAGKAYHSGATDFTSGFHRVSYCPVICVSLFHVIVLSFGFWAIRVIEVYNPPPRKGDSTRGHYLFEV